MADRTLRTASGGGWAITDVTGEQSLYIGLTPWAKSWCLYSQRGSRVTPLAYFRSEKAAQHALWMIDRLARVEKPRGKEWGRG